MAIYIKLLIDLVKSLIIKIVPEIILGEIMSVVPNQKDKKFTKFYKTKKIFKNASAKPVWLGWRELASLHKIYPLHNSYSYDPKSLDDRGKDRAERILSLVPKELEKINNILELGCYDGMVSCNLQRRGKITTAIDNRIDGFDNRAIDEGVKYLQMDAENLEFENEMFDMVFSFDAFEHFNKPDMVLQEAIRVVKPGGFIYLQFGPLFFAPMGLHIYNIVGVPYCQFLFSKELLKEYFNTKGSNPFTFENDQIVSDIQLNGWSLEEYRNLWKNNSHILRRIKYDESTDFSSLNIINKYPSCFKSKVNHFESLTVSFIEVLFRKK